MIISFHLSFHSDIGNESQMCTHAVHVERIINHLQCEPIFGIGSIGSVKCIAIHSYGYTEQ